MSLTNLQQIHKEIVLSPIKKDCFFSIVIPVRNEASYIFRTLQSLANQIDLQNRPFNYEQVEMIFLVNNSSDDSAKIIRAWSDKHPSLAIHLAEESLPPEQANIGYVRRWLMNEAYLRLLKNKSGVGIIATTDGDTEVAPNWMAAIIEEIKNGADAVGGRILIHRHELKEMSAKTRSFHLRDTGYRLMAAELESYYDPLPHDALPRHHQHFNGSFAVTTAAYEKAGGIPEVRFLEDVAFYQALLRNDLRFRHSPRVRVYTSARLEGRTESGLSTQMNEWTVMGENNDFYLVECAFSIKRRLQARQKMREIWQKNISQNSISKDEIKSLADNLLISAETLERELSVVQPFGSLYEKSIHEQNAVGEWRRQNPLVTIEKAIHDLRLLLEKERRAKANLDYSFSQTSSRYFSAR